MRLYIFFVLFVLFINQLEAFTIALNQESVLDQVHLSIVRDPKGFTVFDRSTLRPIKPIPGIDGFNQLVEFYVGKVLGYDLHKGQQKTLNYQGHAYLHIFVIEYPFGNHQLRRPGMVAWRENYLYYTIVPAQGVCELTAEYDNNGRVIIKEYMNDA